MFYPPLTLYSKNISLAQSKILTGYLNNEFLFYWKFIFRKIYNLWNINKKSNLVINRIALSILKDNVF